MSTDTSFEAKPIRDAILAIHHIERLMLTKTDVRNALSIQQAFERCGTVVTGKQQVADTIKKLYQKGLLKKLRESKHHVFWADVPMTDEQFLEYANAPRKGGRRVTVRKNKSRVGHDTTLVNELMPMQKKAQPVSGIPEITVTDTAIVILHAKCKITVEFNS